MCHHKHIKKVSRLTSVSIDTKVLVSTAIETCVRNEAFMAICIQVTVFLVIMPCSYTLG